MEFDPSAALERVEKMWKLSSQFGMEWDAHHVYLEEIVSDRYTLINGLQLLRDELQFSGNVASDGDIAACSADLGIPSVCTTVATTDCGDRIHQGGTADSYYQVVASRFATMSEIGELKLEAFSPTGGGTDDGATLAHVTVAHQLDHLLRERIYSGNAKSFVMAAFDLKTHVGRLNHSDGSFEFGLARESRWREPRSACGAVVGALAGFNPGNSIHCRLRQDLGEANFQFLSQNRTVCADGHDVTAAIAAAIISIQGMLNTAAALTHEMDERGVAHLTACTTVNRLETSDTLLYLARATVFGGEIRTQGFGTDALKYSAQLINNGHDQRLLLTYDGLDSRKHPILKSHYPVRHWKP